MNDSLEPSIPESDQAPIHPLAPVSLVSSLLSLLGCVTLVVLTLALNRPSAMLAVFALPIFGFIGVIAGFLVLASMRKPGASHSGRVPATVGLFLGLVTTVIQVSVIAGALLTWLPLFQTLSPAVDTMLQAAAADDATAARAHLSKATSEALTDEAIASFSDVLESEIGSPITASAGLDIFMKSRNALRDSPSTSPAARGAVPPTEAPRPVELSSDDGSAVAFIFLDDKAMQQDQSVRIVDILVVLTDGRCATLIDTGPAREWAVHLGLSSIR